MVSKQQRLEILERRFSESVQGIYAIVVGNALLFLACVLWGGESFRTDYNAHFSLLTALGVLLLLFIYDWRYQYINLIIVLAYLSVGLIEVVGVGLPAGYIPSSTRIGYGTLMEIFLITLPVAYMAMRFALVFCFLPVLIRLRRIKTED